MIKTYPWQCMECKTCIVCGQPHHEEEMMFCDVCDRGYHTFCVGLRAIPSGKDHERKGSPSPDPKGGTHVTHACCDPPHPPAACLALPAKDVGVDD